MSNEVVVREQENQVVVSPSQQEMLSQVVEGVRVDSRESAAAFLAETVVPHGGE
jgi:hypothetical protein